MADMIARKAGMKYLGKQLQNYEPRDPLYEEYVDERGRTKQKKRGVPPGLSARDAKILKKVQKRAHYLDKGFKILGFRFGWTAIIGLIPFAGDAADVLLNYMLVVRLASQCDIPPFVLSKMFANNAVSAGLGFVPIAGDLMLAHWKANSRNAALLEEFLRVRGEEALKPPAQRSEDPAIIKPGSGSPDGLLTSASGSGQVVKPKSRSMFSNWSKKT